MIEITKCKNYQELSNTVADIVERQLNKKSDSRFILPTGSTPIGLYKELVNRDLNWSNVITYNICFPYDITVWPDMRYGQDVDICLLGIGGNGHIAFNEPGSSFESETRVVDLTEQTIQDNSRFFPSIADVPTKAITMGLKPIMSSKRIILMANGKHKKDILHKALHGKITEDVPASILQTHTNLGVFYSD